MSRAQPASDYVSRSNTGMKNRIINGGMDISQRGTSFVSPVSGTYTLDRFGQTNTTDGFFTVTQNADVPSGNEFQNSLRVAVTTADTSIATAQYATLYHMIEGYNVRDLIGRTFTLSFWIRSSKTGIHCISLRPGGYDRSYIAEYTIIAANTWEYKTITITGGLPTAGTWNYTNGVGLALTFALSNGATYQSTAGSWLAGSFQSTSNQVNCLDTIGNIFAITGVQLEVGSVATPFEHRLYGTELALCQRYYYRRTGTDWAGSVQVSTGTLMFFDKVPVSFRNNGATVTMNPNIVNANYTNVAPTGILWTLTTSNIGYATKTGTATLTAYTTGDTNINLIVFGASWSISVSIISIGSGAGGYLYEASAEL